MIEFFCFVGIGLGLGIFTGLFPGIHLNTVASAILFFSFPGSISMVALIVAMNVMHSFVDFIPSILVGAPSETNFLSVQPGHRMFLKGQALPAIQLTIFGNLAGTVASILLIPVYTLFASQAKRFLAQSIPFVLIAVTLMLVASERKIRKQLVALLLIALSGCLGLATLGTGTNQLFSLVTGFFGLSTLIFSIQSKKNTTPQQASGFSFKTGRGIKAVVLGSVCGSLITLFPAISASHTAFLAQGINQRFSTRSFLVLLGAISAAGTVFSFVALQELGKARTGSAVAIQSLYSLSGPEFLLIIAVILFSAGIAALTCQALAKKSIQLIQAIPYQKLEIGTAIFLVGLSVLFGGLQGLATLGIATCIGLIPHWQGTKKSHCMAFLVVPTVLFYLSF